MSIIDFSLWTSDSSCKEIMIKDYNNYIIQFNDKQSDVINTLLANFSFYDSFKFEKMLNSYICFLDKIAMDNEETFFFLPNDDDEPHNSQYLFSGLKQLSRKYHNRFHSNYLSADGANYYFNKAKKIVIIDDYCGSGQTIDTMLEKLNQKLLNPTDVLVAPMLVTFFAINQIKNSSEKYEKIRLDFDCPNEIRQAKYLSEQKILDDNQLDVLEKISEDNKIKYRYGYNNTEELLAFSYYTPNNTIGILWEDTIFHIPFLSRYGKNFYEERKGTYFYHNYLQTLKKSVKDTSSTKRWKLSVFAILSLCNFTKAQIKTILKIRNDVEYFDFEKKVYRKGILSKSLKERGWAFNNYIDDEIFTRLVFLNENKTRYRTIDEKFNNSRN